MVVVPTPTITPESPVYELTAFVSIVDNGGGVIRTVGTLVFVYPTPGLVIATPVTVPAAPIVTEPNACVVVPMPTVDAILTVAVVYPTPPSEITIEEIDPIPETTAVAAAPV